MEGYGAYGVAIFNGICKENERLRASVFCVPQLLNRAIERDHLDMPVIHEVVPTFKNANVFTVLDAKYRVLQVNLGEKSSYLALVCGPSSKYCWIRMPGISSAPEDFQKRLSTLLDGFSGKLAVADYIILYGSDVDWEEAKGTMIQTLNDCWDVWDCAGWKERIGTRVRTRGNERTRGKEGKGEEHG